LIAERGKRLRLALESQKALRIAGDEGGEVS